MSTQLGLARTRLERSEAVSLVKSLRKKENLSWSVLASRTGIPRSTLRRWMAEEDERDPLWKFLLIGSEVLGFTVVTVVLYVAMAVGTSYLFGGKEEARWMFDFWVNFFLRRN